jgi:hypothetical protein
LVSHNGCDLGDMKIYFVKHEASSVVRHYSDMIRMH